MSKEDKASVAEVASSFTKALHALENGGPIEVKSEKGMGIRFTVYHTKTKETETRPQKEERCRG
jgi:hypothetical protein